MRKASKQAAEDFLVEIYDALVAAEHELTGGPRYPGDGVGLAKVRRCREKLDLLSTEAAN